MAVYRFRKGELEGQLNKGALWAIVYGDLMSYLMILFLIMLSYTLSQGTGYGGKPRVEESIMEIQRVFGGKADPSLEARAQQRDREFFLSKSLEEKIARQGLTDKAKVITTHKRIRLEVSEGILFDSGKAELNAAADPVLKTIAGEMVSVENQIQVEGHTDNVPVRGGRYGSNWELSMARAYAVIRRLEALGVSPKRLSGVGYGEYRPVSDNATPQSRAKNRRIEISLLRSE